MGITNRIVEYGTKPADQFQANPQNWRIHPQSQREAVRASLDELGWIGVVIENARTGHLVDGHERVWQALQDGNADVPYIVVDLSEQEEALALATFDPIAAMAGANREKLEGLLAGVKTGSEALQALISQTAEDAGLFLNGGGPPAEDPGPQVDRAKELREKWQTERGQVWEIGRHRLMCGDSTVAEDVGRLMDGEPAGLFLTDPPYGVSYADKNKYLNTIAFGNRIQVPIENDHLDLDSAQDIWYQACLNAFSICSDTSSYYWFACQGGDQMMMMMMMIGKAGWKVRHELIWVKNNHVLGRSDYNYKHEPILYGWKKDGTHKFYGGFQTSVLEFDKPMRSQLHPTTKPVELISRLIGNSSVNNDIVYDPFLGSGTTMVAAEQLGRRCYGMEIDPAYVAVALERMAGLGLEPKLA